MLVLFTGIFYFTLGNVSPKYRSKLSAIHLVAIAKHKNLSTYGMDALLKPFVRDLKRLVSSCTCMYSHSIKRYCSALQH